MAGARTRRQIDEPKKKAARFDKDQAALSLLTKRGWYGTQRLAPIGGR